MAVNFAVKSPLRSDFPPLHVALIMDGNGRWATARGRPRPEGHRAGAAAVRRVVEAAPGLGIRTLTLFAFSSDNWQRPPREVGALMDLFLTYLRLETQPCVAHGIRLSVLGRRDRLAPDLRRAIAAAEAATCRGQALHLRLAVDYSARDAILRAAHRTRSLGELSRETFARLLSPDTPDVDLLIRTGGEQRLSDFLLWECAYAELYFTPTLWPDFTPTELRAAVEEFHQRERRFGRLPEPVASGISLTR
ncbi:MAG: di-trans,poly-cis-decaprenylcistransferase [Terriglobia bacterium]